MGEGYSKSHWAKDETTKGCKACRKEFNFSRRRHHCRNCGYIFCSECSFRTQPVPQRNIPEPVRVCDDCYYSLLDSGNAPPLAPSQYRLGGDGGAGDSKNTSFSMKHGGTTTNSTTNNNASKNPSSGSPQHPTGTATQPPHVGGGGGEASTVVQQPALPPAPMKTKEQLKSERLAAAMQGIRAHTTYLDASVISVFPVQVDEPPMWAESQTYTLSIADPTSVIISFPQGNPQNTVSLLLSADLPKRSSSSAVDTSVAVAKAAAVLSEVATSFAVRVEG